MRENEFGGDTVEYNAASPPTDPSAVCAYRFTAFSPAFQYIISSFQGLACEASARLLVFEGEPYGGLHTLAQETAGVNLESRFKIRIMLDVTGMPASPTSFDFTGAPLEARAGRPVYVLLMMPRSLQDTVNVSATASLTVMGFPNTAAAADTILRGYTNRPTYW